MTNTVYVIDSAGNVLMETKFRKSHFNEMAKRNWIMPNSWLFPDRTVYAIEHTQLTSFLNEAAL
ncbi:MAG: hypothetical protein N2235_05390 [Fischerella sp.]|nr:hypothetical protein [Fischerella sp.]